jgi:hypothetical protein
MFSTLRNRFGIPGVISVIALVFAMLGGAYAASNGDSGKGATASAKKKAAKGPRGPKGAKGATGAAGPAGPAGAPGAKGDVGAAGAAGEKGATGANGTDGNTVLSGTATPTAAIGTVGDFYIETDVSKIYGPKAASGVNGGWGGGVNLKGADGEQGSPWTELGTLPSGATLTGFYSVRSSKALALDEKVTLVAPISFPLPVEPTPTFVFVGEGEDKSADGCPGLNSAGTPLAEKGTLCVYETGRVQAEFVTSTAALTTGLDLRTACKGTPENGFELPCTAAALWAVTAE